MVRTGVSFYLFFTRSTLTGICHNTILKLQKQKQGMQAICEALERAGK